MTLTSIFPWLVPAAIAGATAFYFYRRRRRKSGGNTIQTNPINVGPRPIGINLTEHTFFSPEFVFKDVFKSNSGWVFLPLEPVSGMSYQALETIPMDENGYPTSVPFDLNFRVRNNTTGDEHEAVLTAIARCYMFRGLPHGYPLGNYVLLSEGEGTMRLFGDAAQVGTEAPLSGTDIASPSEFTFSLNGNGNGFWLEIRSTENSPGSSNIQNIHIVHESNQATYEDAPFTDELLSFLADFQCIRFMDWMRTNNSPITSYDQRTIPNYYSQGLPTGIAYEYLVELCNLLGKDAWVNIPHQADEDYINQFAQFLFDNLHPERRIYVEFSNEVWNGQFSQHRYAWEHEPPIGPGDENWQRAMRFYARNAERTFQIFSDVFAAAPDRIVKVFAGQAAQPAILQYAIDAFEDQTLIDAIAIAPYFGNWIGNELIRAVVEGEFDSFDSLSVDIALDWAEAIVDPAVESPLEDVYSNEIQPHVEIAEENGHRLLTYEGGQHLVVVTNVPPVNGYIASGEVTPENIALVQNLMNDANRHPRMRSIYRTYLRRWYTLNRDLFVHYNSHSRYNENGSYGLREHMNQAMADAPKYRAMREEVFTYNPG